MTPFQMSSDITDNSASCNENMGNKGTLQLFTYFPELPLEIRRQIWAQLLPGKLFPILTSACFPELQQSSLSKRFVIPLQR